MKCKICSIEELKTEVDILLKLGYSYTYIERKVNPEIPEAGVTINHRDLTRHKNGCLIPSLSPMDIDELKAMGVELVQLNSCRGSQFQFLNKSLQCKTIFRPDRP